MRTRGWNKCLVEMTLTVGELPAKKLGDFAKVELKPAESKVMEKCKATVILCAFVDFQFPKIVKTPLPCTFVTRKKKALLIIRQSRKFLVWNLLQRPSLGA